MCVLNAHRKPTWSQWSVWARELKMCLLIEKLTTDAKQSQKRLLVNPAILKKKKKEVCYYLVDCPKSPWSQNFDFPEFGFLQDAQQGLVGGLATWSQWFYQLERQHSVCYDHQNNELPWHRSLHGDMSICFLASVHPIVPLSPGVVASWSSSSWCGVAAATRQPSGPPAGPPKGHPPHPPQLWTDPKSWGEKMNTENWVPK